MVAHSQDPPPPARRLAKYIALFMLYAFELAPAAPNPREHHHACCCSDPPLRDRTEGTLNVINARARLLTALRGPSPMLRARLAGGLACTAELILKAASMACAKL